MIGITAWPLPSHLCIWNNYDNRQLGSAEETILYHTISCSFSRTHIWSYNNYVQSILRNLFTYIFSLFPYRCTGLFTGRLMTHNWPSHLFTIWSLSTLHKARKYDLSNQRGNYNHKYWEESNQRAAQKQNVAANNKWGKDIKYVKLVSFIHITAEEAVCFSWKTGKAT